MSCSMSYSFGNIIFQLHRAWIVFELEKNFSIDIVIVHEVKEKSFQKCVDLKVSNMKRLQVKFNF